MNYWVVVEHEEDGKPIIHINKVKSTVMVLAPTFRVCPKIINTLFMWEKIFADYSRTHPSSAYGPKASVSCFRFGRKIERSLS